MTHVVEFKLMLCSGELRQYSQLISTTLRASVKSDCHHVGRSEGRGSQTGRRVSDSYIAQRPSQSDQRMPLLPVCVQRFMSGCLQAMAAFVEEVDKTALRPLQKQGFLCGAECCDNARTQEELQAW